MKVLIVEDDVRLGNTLLTLLSKNKYDAELVDNGYDGYDYALQGYYDVIILDLMLPGINGFDVIKKLRAEKCNVPILILTAKDSWQDKVNGLDLGADDYLTKPFVPEELYARLRALGRRKDELILNELNYEDLTLDLCMNQLICGSQKIKLPAKEYAIMQMLMTNPTQIATKEDIIMKAWNHDADVEDNNVEVYISFLRKKLKALQTRVTIETVRKIGYHLEANNKK